MTAGPGIRLDLATGLWLDYSGKGQAASKGGDLVFLANLVSPDGGMPRFATRMRCFGRRSPEWLAPVSPAEIIAR